MSSDPFAQSLSRRPMPDLIAERITSAIVNGSLQPGDKLPSEPELARQMQVGRSSLREAIGKLQGQGVVEVRRGRGTYVRDPQEGDDPSLEFSRWSTQEGFVVSEMLELRIGLESTAAGLACVRASEEELSSLKQECANHEEAHANGDLEAMVRTDEAVHEALFACGHNAAIARMYQTLVPGFREFRRRTLSLDGVERRSTEDHRQIYSAVAAGDPAAARRAVVAHLWVLYYDVLSAADPDNAISPPYHGYEVFISP